MDTAGRLAFCIGLSAVGFIAVALRLNLRYGINRPTRRTWAFYFGDIFMVVGYLMGLAFTTLDIWLRHERGKRTKTGHITGHIDVETSFGRFLLRMGIVKYSLSTISVHIIKLAFLCFYFDLRRSLSRRVKRMLYIGSAFALAFMLASTLYIPLSCLPFSDYWTPIPADNCLAKNTSQNGLVQNALHIATDTSLILLGWALVYDLRMQHTCLIWLAISFIFFLGFLTLSTACIRIAKAMDIIHSSVRSEDYIFTAEGRSLEEWVSMCCIAEMNIACVAVALPSFRVYWRKILGKGERGRHARVDADRKVAVKESGGTETRLRNGYWRPTWMRFAGDSMIFASYESPGPTLEMVHSRGASGLEVGPEIRKRPDLETGWSSFGELAGSASKSVDEDRIEVADSRGMEVGCAKSTLSIDGNGGSA